MRHMGHVIPELTGRWFDALGNPLPDGPLSKDTVVYAIVDGIEQSIHPEIIERKVPCDCEDD